MALDIDGFAVLRSMAAHPSLFSDVAVDAAKAARALVVKQVKSKASSLRDLRDIKAALGHECGLILDGLPDSQIKALLAKLDKHRPELKTANSELRRQQLGALLDGTVEPTAKPAPTRNRQKVEKKPSKQPSAPEVLHFSSAGAKRKR